MNKQKFTLQLLKKKIRYNKDIYNIFSKMSKKYKLAIATNAVSETLDICVDILKIRKFCNYLISNENVTTPKPHPEIYLRCLINLGLKQKETLIIENSHYGGFQLKTQDVI